MRPEAVPLFLKPWSDGNRRYTEHSLRSREARPCVLRVLRPKPFTEWDER